MHCASAYYCQATFASGKGAGRCVRYPDDLKCHFPLACLADRYSRGRPRASRATSLLRRELSVQLPGVLANRLRRNNGNVCLLAERLKLVEGILLFCGLR